MVGGEEGGWVSDVMADLWLIELADLSLDWDGRSDFQITSLIVSVGDTIGLEIKWGDGNQAYVSKFPQAAEQSRWSK